MLIDKNHDIQIAEDLETYLASRVEDKLDYQKFYLYSNLIHSMNAY